MSLFGINSLNSCKKKVQHNDADINGEPAENVTVMTGEGTAHEWPHYTHTNTHTLTISVQGRSLLQAHGSLHVDISLM